MINFIDLAAQQDLIRATLDERFSTVLKHGQYVNGPEVFELESALADFVGVKHCISMASGTDALVLALTALEIGPGDEVVTTAFSFAATVESILLVGATPVLVDVDERTYNIDVSKLEPAITARTKAIMPVSLYGQCADFDAVNAIAKKFDLSVIEDGAQSLGAKYHGQRSCGLTGIGCTSFFPSKPLGCYGDGGACFTNSDELATKLRCLRDHGQEGRYHHVRIGFNSRLDTLQAAVLLAKLEIFDREIELRQQVAERYDAMLKACGSIGLPEIATHNESVYAQYTIRIAGRDKFQELLKQDGVPTAVHYPKPLHMQPAYKSLGYSQGCFEVAEKMADQVISLPMHPYLSNETQRVIADSCDRATVVMASE